MTRMARFDVRTLSEAQHMLDYFNAFHDGFIKRMTVASHDDIDEDHSQICTGLFEVECDFAHYNYGYVSIERSPKKSFRRDSVSPLRPYSQVVRARFFDVQDFQIDLGEGYLGNTILALSFTEDRRRRENSTTNERALALHLTRHFYVERVRRHEMRESRLFTFRRAVVVELPPEQ